jgi:hypothetical protein
MDLKGRLPLYESALKLIKQRINMKASFTLLVLFLILYFQLQAQTDSIVVRKTYSTWIYPIEKSRIKQGSLFEVKDSSLLISEKYKKKNFENGKFNVIKVNASSIDIIKLRKKGNVGIGALVGGAAGIVCSIITGLIINSHYYAAEGDPEGGQEFITTINSIMLVGIGTGIGLLIGSSKKHIPIKGSRTKFDEFRDTLTTYSIRYNSSPMEKTFSRLSDTLVDKDGNVHHILALGGQLWMAENLKAKHYCDGIEIPELMEDSQKSGKLYTWNDIKNGHLCPEGWHVPSQAEWTSMYNSLGGYHAAANKLEKHFSLQKGEAHWWTSTELDSLNSQSFYLNNKTIGVMLTNTPKTTGLSVRCIRDN